MLQLIGKLLAVFVGYFAMANSQHEFVFFQTFFCKKKLNKKVFFFVFFVELFSNKTKPTVKYAIKAISVAR